MRPVRALMLVAAPLLLSACASFGRATASMEPPRIVEVQNALEAEVAVYLRRGNYEHPLGVVPASGRATLVIPSSLIPASGQVRLLGDPRGVGRAFEMQPIRLTGTRFATWDINKDARYSVLSVWSSRGVPASDAADVAIR